MVFERRVKKSRLFAIFSMGRTFRSLRNTAIWQDQKLVLFLNSARHGISPLEPCSSTDSKKPLERDLQRYTSFFGSLGGSTFPVLLCVEFQTSALYFANLSGRSHLNRPSLGR